MYLMCLSCYLWQWDTKWEESYLYHIVQADQGTATVSVTSCQAENFGNCKTHSVVGSIWCFLGPSRFYVSWEFKIVHDSYIGCTYCACLGYLKARILGLILFVLLLCRKLCQLNKLLQLVVVVFGVIYNQVLCNIE